MNGGRLSVAKYIIRVYKGRETVRICQGSACKIFSISKILHLAQNVKKNLTSYRSYGHVKLLNLTILQSYGLVKIEILQVTIIT